MSASRARNPTTEMPRIASKIIIDKNTIGAWGMREIILFEAGDSYN
jgi:hypothetical protein